MAGTRGDTRARILDTAWELVRERGSGRSPWPTSPPPPASPASCSTSTSRTGPGCWWPWPPPRRPQRLRRPGRRDRSLPPVAALERLLRLWFAYLPEILPVARALEAAAVNGDEGGVAWRDRMADLRELFAAAVDRVQAAGRLAAGWTPRRPPTGSGPGPSPPPSQHLVGDRGWPAADYVDRVVHLDPVRGGRPRPRRGSAIGLALRVPTEGAVRSTSSLPTRSCSSAPPATSPTRRSSRPAGAGRAQPPGRADHRGGPVGLGPGQAAQAGPRERGAARQGRRGGLRQAVVAAALHRRRLRRARTFQRLRKALGDAERPCTTWPSRRPCSPP